jgi:hypothetical protein
MHVGRCLCGGVEFSIAGDLAPIEICYCKQCQRAQGTAMATNIPVSVASLRILRGEQLIKSFESSPGKQRCFCGSCGSPIYSKRETLPGVVRIRIGLLDGNPAAKPIAHFHTNSKPIWWAIGDDLPQRSEG